MSSQQTPYVAIIDYGMGNLFSVIRACEHVRLKAVITHEKKEILGAAGVILPGVGAFGDAMRHLEELDLVSPVKDFVHSGKPFLGICLGMQLLMSESEEFGIHKGLDIVRGAVVKFSIPDAAGKKSKVPQVGWNRIFPSEPNGKNIWNGSPLKDIEGGEYMYFVHSYYSVPVDREVILSTSTYEQVTYCSALKKGNIFAAQFHPEKSASAGLQIYKNWASEILGG